MAEALRQASEAHRYSDGVTTIQVTASLGVSSLAANKPRNEEVLISQADDALYKAKEQGRNRVEVFSG